MKPIVKPESKTDAWKIFDQISKKYDIINRVLSLGQDTRWRKKVARNLPLKPHLQILDLATGTADQLIAIFNSKASIQKAVGIDLSKEMLKIGRKKIERYPKATLIHGDAQKIPFDDAMFDAATFSFGIRNVESPLTSLKDIHRVLKPNGRCLILEFSMPPKWIRPFFLFYLRKVLPKLGGFLSKNLEAYRYLNRTIESFPSGKEFLSIMDEAGFHSLRKISMNFGSVTLYIGDK
jgi:demethylmenaquinone methyltransferase/2-methoxy-6-polyprenyl-1,4-benzoquinol methylase